MVRCWRLAADCEVGRGVGPPRAVGYRVEYVLREVEGDGLLRRNTVSGRGDRNVTRMVVDCKCSR